MSAIVRETSEYVEMSDSITLCIVKDGAAGTSINMKTGVNSPDALPSSGASVGDSYIIDGHLWTYTGGTASDATHHNGFTNCGKVSGEAGKNNYVHVAWSNKQNPTKDDIVLSNTDGNAYAYMGTWVSETKEDTADEAVNMAKWVYVKGDKGDTPTFAKLRVNHSALHYNPSTGKWDYDSVTVTIVIFTSKGTQIPDYGDTKEYYWLLDDDTTVKRSSGMGFSATLNAASHRATLYKDGSNVAIDTITVPMVRDGQDGQGADGKGALEIICDPETIVLDTDDNGLVKDYSNAWAGLMCVRDGKEVRDVTYTISSMVNCEDATVNDNGIVTITSVTTQSVNIDSSTVEVSSTSGSVTVSVTENATGVTYTKTVPFTVNVARYTGGLKADNKKFESAYNYLTNDGKSKDFKQFESKIRQTAKEISLHVSEKRVGRRNLLPGSAFRKQGEGCSIVQDGQDAINGICINGGYDGVNCARLRNEGNAGAAYPRISWDGARNSNVKVAKGKKYTLSFWAKRLSSTEGGYEISTQFFLQDGANGYTRPYGALKNGSFTVKSQGEWEFIQDTVTIPSEAKSNYVEVCICLALLQRGMAEILVCRPMLEEGDEYNGWTLSEQDYDYVGGNLLDGTATLAKTGNVEVLDETTVTQGGYNNESASVKAILLPTMEIGDFLQYSTKDMGLKVGEDCMLSFYARAASGYAPGGLQCYLYSPSTGIVMTESSHEKLDFLSNPGDGDLHTHITPTTAWKRYWVHWRPMGNVPQYILFRLVRPGTNKESYDSSTSYNVGDVVLYGGTYYVCQKAGIGYAPGASSHWEATEFAIEIARPKLEVGATMTEWTAKRSDMVDKQALYATGIDIDSKKITLTADHTYVRTNDGTPMVLIDADGNLTNVKVNADMVNVSATHKLSISGNGSMVVAMDNFKLDERGNASFKGSIESTSGRISFLTFTDSGMYSATSSSDWGLGLMSTNISVRGTPGGRHSLVCLGNGEVDATGGDANTYPTSLVNGQNVNYCNLIQVKDGGTGNGRDAAALGIETDGDFCLSAMGGLSHLQGLALDASTTTNGSSPNRTLFLCSGGHFTMPSKPKDGQLVIVIQTTRSGITFYGGSKSFMKGASTSNTATSGSAGQWNFFVYDDSVSSWRCVYANGGLF